MTVSDNQPDRNTERRWIVILLVVAGAVIGYWPALNGGFIWDDEHYVYANPTLADPGGLVKIWTAPSATPQYYRMVHTSYWLEYRLWELNPTGYHWVNLTLHLLTAGCVASAPSHA